MINTERTPFLSYEDFLIAPLRSGLSDHEIRQYEDTVLAGCAKSKKLRAVVVDVSGFETMDLFEARTLCRLNSKLELMDIRTVIVGLRPEVALLLVEMGITLPHLKTAVNLEHGIRILKQLKHE